MTKQAWLCERVAPSCGKHASWTLSLMTALFSNFRRAMSFLYKTDKTVLYFSLNCLSKQCARTVYLRPFFLISRWDIFLHSAKSCLHSCCFLETLRVWAADIYSACFLTVKIQVLLFYIPARHAVLVPFGMDDHIFYPNGLLRTLLLIHVMLSKNHSVCVESGKHFQTQW